ncbi:long-chain acyl-CoA synthetase [Virgibacillus subterraneus]|uniref:Long-chain acyl-CoA synthetase n=1 Tax=Virgibacillus subterraneus TaxID=621109 RepID=A0A1H8Z9X9_9BACI|nr:long-chain fatty acid--CoA ligase [Virgibacillus subterraneus]SEP60408.1 long-chain acyl-CoA synthetase [Virgibacillus subterraneus]
MNRTWLKHYPEHIKKELEIPNDSVPDMLKNAIANYGDHQALYFYGKEITYKELGTQTGAFASSLQQDGLSKGDRVAVMLPNCPHYVISYYGTLQAGGTVTQVNPMLVGKELEHILTDSGAETIVIYEPLLPVLNQIIDNTSVKHVIKVNLEGRDTEDSMAVGFTAFLKQAKRPPEPVEIDPKEDVAVLQYTGGTTGRSKGVMLTHRNILTNTLQVYEYFKDEIQTGKDRYLTVIPLFHVFGMTACMNLSIYTGSLSIMLPKFELEEVLQTIKDLKPTSFPGVPTMYVALTSHPIAEEYGIDSIRICNSGSAPMPGELLRSFEEKTGAKILEGYGLSESAPVTHCNPFFAERKPGSIGIGIPSTDYKIVDLAEGTEEVPVGETGEIVIRGPQVMKGYWNMPEETANTLRDGWLYTGDIARMDEDGYAYIVDRKKDLIIASGFNIYPRDVEEVIYEHPAVQEAVVVGIPDAYRGETVKAVVVLKDGKQCDEEELIAYCKENMASYKVPRVVEFRDELPKTNVGKILRRAIRDESLQK